MMKKFYGVFFPVVLAMLFSATSYGQKNFFSDLPVSSIKADQSKRVIIPQKFRALELNASDMRDFLWSLPGENQFLNNRTAAPILRLPMPDGSFANFHVWESSIQEPGLEARFPEMKTFSGQGIDDPYATIRFDYSPYFGFRAQILSSVTGRIYIDPYANGNINYVISYYHIDNKRSYQVTCGVEEDPLNLAGKEFPTTESANCRGTEMRTYRLAVACTGEYAQAPGVNAGSNQSILHAAILTTVNRVVGVYEKELSIRMVIVDSNHLVEFLSASTDPFNGNNNANVLINESHNVITANIGTANFDIGHTFSTGGGGLAQLNSPCGSSSKGRGITGSPFPTGDGYDIDYVSHEMGHQFGGNHTMAGCGSSPSNTKYEPGGGTTIQAYAGICGSQDLQPNSDPYFHGISFDEISNFVMLGNGTTCGTVSNTGNTLPVIAPLMNNNLSIPPSTPFVLSGSATDADGDALTYSWEGWDWTGSANWNSGLSAPAGNSVPLFRSRIPKTEGSRTFPDIRIIQANYPLNPPVVMNGLKGEVLSPVARTMKFKLTVRDNRAGGGGVVSAGTEGCQTADTFKVNVVGAIPFAVLVPNGFETYAGNSTQTVTWNVASTTGAPYNVANVKISLSTDGGATYPTVIVPSTPNDGSESITIPNVATTTARIKVEAIGNIFFDISNNNFTITQAAAGFNFNSPAPVNVPCGGAANASVTLGTNSIGGYSTAIALSATAGVPAGTTVSFAPASVVPGNSSVVTLNNVNTLAPGNYNITITGVSGTLTETRIVTFVVQPGAAPTITTQPANSTVCAGANTSFSVTATGATGYQWQVSTDGGTNYTDISSATSASYALTAVTSSQNTYRYRVIVTGTCGTSTSNAGILTVQSAPAINTQPVNATACVGFSSNFTVAATGTGLTYQWQLSTNGGSSFTNIGGATSATYTQTGVTLAMDGNQYRVIVSGTCPSAVTSSAATLTVGNAAAINTQPASQTVCIGDAVTLSVSATGSSLSYQWQLSEDAGATWTNVAGATNATLSLGAATTAITGNQYRVEVFSCSPTGILSSVATVTVNEPVDITTEPISQTVCAPDNVSFTVAATGSNLSYQWQVNPGGNTTWNNIAAATTATYNAGATTVAMNGNKYRVIVTGSCNPTGVQSVEVTLTVNSLLTISSQPADMAVCIPGNASFTVGAAGSGLTYQWQVSTNNGTSWNNVSGATSATLALTGLTPDMNGNLYRAQLTGTCNNLTSDDALLTVNNPVDIVTQPTDIIACEGNDVALTVVASGSTITYQWEVSVENGPFVPLTNNAIYSGVTSATLSITDLRLSLDSNRYRVVVSGVPCGVVTSDVALLSVNRAPAVVLNVSPNTNITPYTPSEAYVTVSPPGNYIYEWTINGSPININTHNFPVTVDNPGVYQVTVTDAATGCGTTSETVTVTIKEEKGIFIYPNPSTGRFVVRYYNDNSQLPSTSTVHVYDSKGARVSSNLYTSSINYGRMEVNLNTMAPGVYMIDVMNKGERIVSGKVIIQH